MVGFTFEELPYCCLFKAWVSKGKNVFTSTHFPVPKFASLEHVGELYGLPLILKRLIDHAYGANPQLEDELAMLLRFMVLRLETAKPKKVDTGSFTEWLVFADAAYEKETKCGGLGAVLVDAAGQCKTWFSVRLDHNVCGLLGALDKETIIYELELLAACLALGVWKECLTASNRF